MAKEEAQIEVMNFNKKKTRWNILFRDRFTVKYSEWDQSPDYKFVDRKVLVQSSEIIAEKQRKKNVNVNFLKILFKIQIKFKIKRM